MEYSHPEYLIDPEQLAARLNEPQLRIVDATVFLVPAETGYRADSGQEKYDQGHIPGAAFMDLIRKFSDTSTGLGFSLPEPDALADALGELGIGNVNDVVIYSSGHMMWATRAFWLLRYAGHQRVAVLNGGLRRWQAEGLTVSNEACSYPATAYTPDPQPASFVDQTGMQQAMGAASVCTVNALSPEVYAGTGEMSYGRRGHIPGSLNLHYDDLMDGGNFKSADALHAALSASGMLDAERVITYCGGGISATIDAFACLLVGKHEVAVYDGSMSEWVRDESLPLTLGETP
ncbi:MAG: sulfurtransferase [Gammaproteobacteria bacterium]|nr:sulfurtransferase [Gammaproteobacteria bacterium]